MVFRSNDCEGFSLHSSLHVIPQVYIWDLTHFLTWISDFWSLSCLEVKIPIQTCSCLIQACRLCAIFLTMIPLILTRAPVLAEENLVLPAPCFMLNRFLLWSQPGHILPHGFFKLFILQLKKAVGKKIKCLLGYSVVGVVVGVFSALDFKNRQIHYLKKKKLNIFTNMTLYFIYFRYN